RRVLFRSCVAIAFVGIRILPQIAYAQLKFFIDRVAERNTVAHICLGTDRRKIRITFEAMPGAVYITVVIGKPQAWPGISGKTDTCRIDMAWSGLKFDEDWNALIHCIAQIGIQI